jgi:hypothetical protein
VQSILGQIFNHFRVNIFQKEGPGYFRGLPLRKILQLFFDNLRFQGFAIGYNLQHVHAVVES